MLGLEWRAAFLDALLMIYVGSIEMAKMKMWLSKYALSSGISDVEGDITLAETGKYLSAGWGFFRVGRDCFETREEAVNAAESMRKRKIVSLKKQLDKLEMLTFEE